jgi:ABC-type amino acid transport substrate-binding protein
MRVLAAAIIVGGLAGATPALSLGVCIEGSYPPFSDVDDSGNLIGFDVDIGAALCEAIGESCDFVQVSWDRMIPSLLGGTCDAIISSMSDTAERRQQIDFSARYYRVPVRFVAAADAGLSDSDEALADKVVGVQRDTVNQRFMQAHFPGTPLRLYGNQEHVLLDLTLGRLDAVLGESVQLEAGFLDTAAGQGFAFFGRDHFDPAIQGAGAAVGVRKEDGALRDSFTEAITAIRANGVYQGIAARYFDTDIYGE